MKQPLVITLASALSLFVATWPKNRSEKLISTIDHTSPTSQEKFSLEALKRQKQVEDWIKLKKECEGIYGDAEETHMGILDVNGSVNLKALEEHEIPASQFDAVKEAILRARKRMEESFISRLEEDPTRTAPQHGIYAYRIPSDRHLGDQILQELNSSLASVCGDEKGAILFRAIRPSHQFGCYGRQELQIQIQEDSKSPHGWKVKFQALEPFSRTKLSSKTISTPENLKFCFGSAFNIRN